MGIAPELLSPAWFQVLTPGNAQCARARKTAKISQSTFMMPLLHPPFSPYSTPIVHEEVKGTASVMEPEKPEVPKKRKADEAYINKKTRDSSKNGIVP